MPRLLRPLLYLWASPTTLLGLIVGAAGLATGGKAQVRRGALEFTGGAVSWLFNYAPGIRFAGAMTLGHVIIGRTLANLEHSREHEHVHVRQYERWGPLFVPLYLGSSLAAWWRGGDSYRDNCFEREAFAADERRRREA